MNVYIFLLQVVMITVEKELGITISSKMLQFYKEHPLLSIQKTQH